MKLLTVNPRIMIGLIGCQLFAVIAAGSHPIAKFSPKIGTSLQSPQQGDLYDEIARMDSALFNAFNAHSVIQLKTFFSKNLEFFHDKNGLTTYQQTTKDFQSMFDAAHDMHRELGKGSLEVYPLKDYGAIEIGAHTFTHSENGHDVSGAFKFVMIWQKQNGSWKLTRVISYGHG